jgi:1-acyl-sn-glycerol-3-phosphate acyltransferase
MSQAEKQPGMRPWVYTPSPLLQKTVAEQLTTFPREPSWTVSGLRLLGTILLRGFCGIYFRLRVTGRAHLPRTGPFVLVANHGSHLDAVALSCALPLRQWTHAYAAAAQDYFFKDFFRALVAILTTNAMPFDRREDPARSLEQCADLLQVSREALVMFPEGTRSPDGSVQLFRPGVGRLVAGTEIPVVPAFIGGAARAWPKGSAIPRPLRVTVAIGAPRRYPGVTASREGAIAIADDLRRAVMALEETVQR